MNQSQITTTFTNQNNNQRNKTMKKHQQIIKWIGISEIVLSLFAFCGGIAEVILSGVCDKYGDYDYGYGHGRYCLYYRRTLGQGMWCSVLPFIAGIFGVVCKSTVTRKKIGLFMGFSIAGSIFTITMTLLELAWLSWRGPFRSLQIIMACFAGINTLLLITGASFSCCFCSNVCCVPNQQVVYVAYNPSNIQATQMQGATIANPQIVTMPATTGQHQVVPMTTSQLQQYTFAPQVNPVLLQQQPPFQPFQQPQPQQQPQSSSNQPPQYEPVETKTVPQ